MALHDLTVSSVIQAIEEFDRIGRDAFLHKYNLGRARDYFLVRDGRHYDSKAIAAAAHGYLPGGQPLRNPFSGGERTVKKHLERLNFDVTGPETGRLPSPGEQLSNGDISDRFAVGVMGGMRRSTKLDLLVLISDPFKGLYQDRWEGDVLHYTGMGPTGDQDLQYAQNKTLAQSPETDIPVHLLEALEPQKYTYAGEVRLIGKPYQETQIDEEGQARLVWMFPLRIKEGGRIPELTIEQARKIEETQARSAAHLSLEELKARAERARAKPSTRTTHTAVFVRDAAVAALVKRLAAGTCDLCAKPAPFVKRDAEPYLECHHITWLAKGGIDKLENAVALCPNCHRKMHILNAPEDRQKLRKKAIARATYPENPSPNSSM